MKMRKSVWLAVAAATGMLGLSAQAAVTVIADYAADFPVSTNGAGSAYAGTEVPNTGWNYYHSTNLISAVNYLTSGDYQAMIPNTTVSPETWATKTGNLAVQDPRFSVEPGECWPGASGNNTIAAYTIQPGEEGPVSIVNSKFQRLTVGTARLYVYVNDQPTAVNVVADGVTIPSFGGNLGTLNVGDTVNVICDPDGGGAGDRFYLDYQLVNGSPLLFHFSTLPEAVNAGQTSTLSWLVATNLNSLTVSPSIGGQTDMLAYTSNGVGVIVSDALLADTNYQLVAVRGAESATGTVSIAVNPLQINSFAATPAEIFVGSSASLAWNVAGAAHVAVDWVEGATNLVSTTANTGNKAVAPPLGLSTYILTATNALETLSATTTVSVVEAPVGTTIVDADLVNGPYNSNGGFEFNTNGTQSVNNSVNNLAHWIGNGGTPIPSLNIKWGVIAPRAVTWPAAAGVGSGISVQVGVNAALTTKTGGFLNTLYPVDITDSFILSFAWVGDTGTGAWESTDPLEVRLFTSSDDTLAGTLTPLFSTNILKAAAASAAETVTIYNIGATNALHAGKQLWLSLSSAAGTSDNSRLDNVTLWTVSGDTSGGTNTMVLAISGGQAGIVATNVNPLATYTLQGTANLVFPDWIDLATTTGVSSLNWQIPTTNTVQFFRIISAE